MKNLFAFRLFLPPPPHSLIGSLFLMEPWIWIYFCTMWSSKSLNKEHEYLLKYLSYVVKLAHIINSCPFFSSILSQLNHWPGISIILCQCTSCMLSGNGRYSLAFLEMPSWEFCSVDSEIIIHSIHFSGRTHNRQWLMFYAPLSTDLKIKEKASHRNWGETLKLQNHLLVYWPPDALGLQALLNKDFALVQNLPQASLIRWCSLFL